MIQYITKLINKLISSNENNRAIFYNTVGAFVIKGGALIISLYMIPAYIKYFNDQQILGLWFTLLSVLSWILSFDLGIGNGLRNNLVKAIANRDDMEAKKYISAAYFFIGGAVLLLVLISTVIFRYINWNIVLNVPIYTISNRTLNITIGIVFCGIMIQFFLKLITSILYSMQKSAINNLLILATSIIILIYVLLSKSSDLPTKLISLAIIYVLALNIPLLLATIIVFSGSLKRCKPNFNYFEKKYANEVMKLGGIFFWVQIMYMILTTTNEFLISWLTTPDMVVEYQIYNKLFTLIGFVFILTLSPIWSAITKAQAERDYLWIKKLYKLLKLMAFLAILCEFLIILFIQFFINLWLGDNAIQLNYLYAVLFAIFGSLLIWNGVMSTIANGIGKLQIQSISFTIGAIIKIPIAWILVRLLDSWIGVILANIIAIILYSIIQPIWLNKYLNKIEIGDDNYVQR